MRSARWTLLSSWSGGCEGGRTGRRVCRSRPRMSDRRWLGARRVAAGCIHLIGARRLSMSPGRYAGRRRRRAVTGCWDADSRAAPALPIAYMSLTGPSGKKTGATRSKGLGAPCRAGRHRSDDSSFSATAASTRARRRAAESTGHAVLSNCTASRLNSCEYGGVLGIDRHPLRQASPTRAGPRALHRLSAMSCAGCGGEVKVLAEEREILKKPRPSSPRRASPGEGFRVRAREARPNTP